jgi:fatty acid-binding protein DegV
VPISITDSQSKVYQDNNKEIPYETLLKRLSNGENFKTSMTPLGQLMDTVEEMSKEYEEIIFLPVSKGLSGQ